MTLSMLYFVAAVLQSMPILFSTDPHRSHELLSTVLLLCDSLFINWNVTAPAAVCGSRLVAFVAVGTTNLLIDFAVIILPMPMLWSLQLPVAKKLGLTALFGIGLVYVLPSLSLTLPIFALISE